VPVAARPKRVVFQLPLGGPLLTFHAGAATNSGQHKKTRCWWSAIPGTDGQVSRNTQVGRNSFRPPGPAASLQRRSSFRVSTVSAVRLCCMQEFCGLTVYAAVPRRSSHSSWVPDLLQWSFLTACSAVHRSSVGRAVPHRLRPRYRTREVACCTSCRKSSSCRA
jgi:hypothetical protein